MRATGLDTLRNGAARGTRTPDPRFTKAVLYQLSYCGDFTGALIIEPRRQIRKNRSAGHNP